MRSIILGVCYAHVVVAFLLLGLATFTEDMAFAGWALLVVALGFLWLWVERNYKEEK